MKTKLKLLLLSLSLFGYIGCAMNNYTETTKVNGDKVTRLNQFGFFQKTSQEGLRVSPKTGLSIKAVDSETQSDAIEAAARGAAQGVVKGVKP